MELWTCEHCGHVNRGEYWEPCKCGMLRQYADSEFAKRLFELALKSPEEHRKMEQEAAKRHMDQQLEAIHAAGGRIGTTARKRLEWAIDCVYALPRTGENIADFERDIYFFGVLAGRIAYGDGGGVHAPAKGYGKRILGKFREVIQKAIARERITLPSYPQWLVWWPGDEYRPARYGTYIDTEMNDLEVIAVDALSKAILEYGHLIRECPAPALRAKPGEKCGKWFLAKRPNQEYCSATCVSRKTTRDNPPKAKKTKQIRKVKKAKK